MTTKSLLVDPKETRYKKFLEADDGILDALASLGEYEELPSDEILKQLQLRRFICLLYNSKNTSVEEYSQQHRNVWLC